MILCQVIGFYLIIMDITEHKRLTAELQTSYDKLEERVEARTAELRDALADLRTLSGLLPICAECKNIRDDKGYWNKIESYVSKHSDAEFSHSICPACANKLYPDLDSEDPQ
jgi:C4-dicarboxylate-specific signal transduction histidine kinase